MISLEQAVREIDRTVLRAPGERELDLIVSL